MNDFHGIGRLTKDPEIGETKVKKTKTAKFTIAIDRQPKIEGQQEADFIRVVVYGKQAENCGKYIGKGSLVAVSGAIQSRTYTNPNGDTVFVSELAARKVEFLDYYHKNKNGDGNVSRTPENEAIPEGFSEADEESIPF